MKSYTFIDLFAGCGGLSLGLSNAGWKGVFAVEKNPHAFDTLKHNLITKSDCFDWPAWLQTGHHNINDVLTNHSQELISLRGNIDLVAGGPPCQGFSFAGKRIENDHRNKLIDSYIQFINLVKPKLVLFENVKGFTLGFNDRSILGKNYSNHVKQIIEKMGYEVGVKLLDFCDYGVPQRRTRFILVGILKSIKISTLSFFEDLENNRTAVLAQKGLKTLITLGEAISDLLEAHGVVDCPDSKGFKSGKYSKVGTPYQKYLRNGKRKGMIPDSHRFVNHSKKIRERFQFAIDNNLGPAGYKTHFNLKKNGTKRVYDSEPAPTLTTLPDDYIHYCEPRVFTVREFARIQSFPDWFEFKGSYTTGGKQRVNETPRYTQIGNAIPPLFSEQCGITLREIMENG